MNTEFIKKGLQKHDLKADVVKYSSNILIDDDNCEIDDILILEKYDAIMIGLSRESM